MSIEESIRVADKNGMRTCIQPGKNVYNWVTIEIFYRLEKLLVFYASDKNCGNLNLWGSTFDVHHKRNEQEQTTHRKYPKRKEKAIPT